MADETQMKNWLQKYGPNGGRVIIFQNGCPAKVGAFNKEAHETVNTSWRSITYNIYIGPQGEWENRGDLGWANWAFQGQSSRNGNKVTF